MAASFYVFSGRKIKFAAYELLEKGILTALDSGHILVSNVKLAENYDSKAMCFVYVIHHKDFIYKVCVRILRLILKVLIEVLPYEHEFLQYFLIEKKFMKTQLITFVTGHMILMELYDIFTIL